MLVVPGNSLSLKYLSFSHFSELSFTEVILGCSNHNTFFLLILIDPALVQCPFGRNILSVHEIDANSALSRICGFLAVALVQEVTNARPRCADQMSVLYLLDDLQFRFLISGREA